MNEFFPDVPPREPPSPEEKTRLARKFRRRALFADSMLLMGFLCLGLGCVFRRWAGGFAAAGLPLLFAAAAANVITFSRCPCCGRLVRRGEWFGPFVWRGFECPVCWFSPDWSK